LSLFERCGGWWQQFYEKDEFTYTLYAANLKDGRCPMELDIREMILGQTAKA